VRATLRWLRRGGESALVVPVESARGPVTAAWGRTPPPWLRGMPPHVTVLYPFIPARQLDAAVDDGLRRLVAGMPAFELSLSSVARSPGVLYLQPEPPEPFVRLTEAIVARWPQYPPYLGAHPTVVPHVTVAEGEEPAGLEERLLEALPIRATAAEVWLMCERRDGSWGRRATLPLRKSQVI
jgi:2'-5' RNA ligase